MSEVVARFHDPCDLHQRFEIEALLGSQRKLPKERHYSLEEVPKICHFEVTDSVLPVPNRSASECLLEDPAHRVITLRDVEAHRHLPRNEVIVPLSEGRIEASFSVRESCEVVTEIDWNLGRTSNVQWPFLLISCSHSIVTVGALALLHKCIISQ